MVKEDLLIREIEPGDKAAVRALTMEAYAEYTESSPVAFWKVYRQRLIDTLENTGSATHLVAVQGQNIVGSVLLYPAGVKAYGNSLEVGSEPEVRLMAVSPAVRGQGVGTALLAECIQRASQDGATALGLHTMNVMKAALRIYEKEGFVRVPASDFEVGEVLVMGFRKDLALSSDTN